MKSRLLTLLVLVLLLTACQPADWKEFSSKEGAFSVLMPGTPTEQTQKADTQAGTIEVHMFIFEQNGAAYMVGYNDYPEAIVQQADPSKMLDGARDGMVSNTQGKLLGEQVISLDKYPGREIQIETSDGKLTMKNRVYLVNNRLYQVGVVTPKEESNSANITKFLASFKLQGK